MSGVNSRKLDLKSILGLLSLAASLALISPGVRVVRADETPAAAPPGARERPQRQAAVSSDLPVVLDTRGDTYTFR